MSLSSYFGLTGAPGWIVTLALLVVSLLLIFAGRKVVKVIAFLVVGLVGAAVGGTLAEHFLPSLGSVAYLLGALIGFVLGGVIGIFLVIVGVGLAVGYGAYLLTVDVSSSTTAGLVVGFVFFIIGVVLYGKILTLVTALAGGFLLYDVLRSVGLSIDFAAIIAALITLIGLAVDFRSRRRNPQPLSTA